MEAMRYRRRREDKNVLTLEDGRTHFMNLLTSPTFEGMTWQDWLDRGGISDADLRDLFTAKMGTCRGSSISYFHPSRWRYETER